MELKRYWLKIDPFMMVNNVFIQLKFPLSFSIVISLQFIHSDSSAFVCGKCRHPGMIFKKMAVPYIVLHMLNSIKCTRNE
jgi:hypothetical protein